MHGISFLLRNNPGRSILSHWTRPCQQNCDIDSYSSCRIRFKTYNISDFTSGIIMYYVVTASAWKIRITCCWRIRVQWLKIDQIRLFFKKKKKKMKKSSMQSYQFLVHNLLTKLKKLWPKKGLFWRQKKEKKKNLNSIEFSATNTFRNNSQSPRGKNFFVIDVLSVTNEKFFRIV